MPDLEMSGPFLLTPGTIEKQIGNVISPGVILFGLFDMHGTWKVQSVDRSDSHIRARLWAHVADYPYFSYRLCSSPEEAYRMHCELFHRFRPKYDHHPCSPEGKHLSCKVCSKDLDCEHIEAIDVA